MGNPKQQKRSFPSNSRFLGFKDERSKKAYDRLYEKSLTDEEIAESVSNVAGFIEALIEIDQQQVSKRKDI